jgi:hypothetical protein
MKRKWVLAGVALACLVTLSVAGTEDKWLHVRVEEGGEKGERVSINIPLDIVERMLPAISVDELQDGKLILDGLDDDLEGIDLRELAAAVRDAPDADFVRVESDDETVRVAKEGEFLVVRVEEGGRHSNETVRIRVPLPVVDALVGDDPNQLDLAEALRALSEYEGEPLVEVQSDDESVRIWIDSSDSGG